MTPIEIPRYSKWVHWFPAPSVRSAPDLIFGKSLPVPPAPLLARYFCGQPVAYGDDRSDAELMEVVRSGFACLKCGRSSAIGGQVGCSELCQSCQP